MAYHKTPKSALLEFYQTQGNLQSVLFQTGEADDFHITHPKFICKLSLPPAGSFSGQDVIGEGRTKKGAEHAAAEKALGLLASGGFISTHAQGAGSYTAGQASAPGSQAQTDQVQQLSAQLSRLLQESQELQGKRRVSASDTQREVAAGEEVKRSQQATSVPKSESSAKETASLKKGLNIVDVPKDIAALSEKEAKELLAQAKEEIAKLKAEAADERGRKKFVAEVLLAVGDGHQQYGALRGFRA